MAGKVGMGVMADVNSFIVDYSSPKLPGPYTQRICVPGYWPVNTLETQRINHPATVEFAFYTHRRHQSSIFSLNPAFRKPRRAKMSRDEIRSRVIKLAGQWRSLIGTNGIETRADLARYLGVSRARVTKVLRRLNTPKFTESKNLYPG